MKMIKLSIAALALVSSLSAASAKDAYVEHANKAATLMTGRSIGADSAAKEAPDPLHQQIFHRGCTQNYGTGYCD
ncbi:hypothetical protein [Methylocella tundrae]|uniref:Uncharacterized protein n=1 Tax=Methylocella tundrae TaxID=227605 RepID=A0A4U8YXY4_METTU|nr:hypothetical protein [Methylocella tundrae]WPP05236.1 hypothetical protein SIN04_05255 [Methylocella tundrae]VFU07582.1 exported protein of unknown function [Methylocella tundrae]